MSLSGLFSLALVLLGAQVIESGDAAGSVAAERSVSTWRPTVVAYHAPIYPAGPMSRGLEGACTVLLRVDQAGLAVIETVSCSDAGFETATREAVARWRFTPFPGPEPLSERFQQPVTFRLE